MPCTTIIVTSKEQPPSPQPKPQVGLESYLPIVALLGAAAIAYHIRKR